MSELLQLATRIATQAGERALELRRNGVEVTAHKSSQTDVVTRADGQNEDFIRAELASARPHDGFFGEESTAIRGTSGLHWVVDPIDGTVNYLYGIPAYAVSIAVVEGDSPDRWTTLAGCVVNPAIGEVYAAARGAGATLNRHPLPTLASDVDLAQAMVATGFSYVPEQRTQQATIVRELIARVRDIRRMGSAALDLCQLAAGRVDAYFESGLHQWDFAAGALIAREAGAYVGSLFGERENEESLVACVPGLRTPLSQALRECGAP